MSKKLFKSSSRKDRLEELDRQYREAQWDLMCEQVRGFLIEWRNNLGTLERFDETRDPKVVAYSAGQVAKLITYPWKFSEDMAASSMQYFQKGLLNTIAKYSAPGISTTQALLQLKHDGTLKYVVDKADYYCSNCIQILNP